VVVTITTADGSGTERTMIGKHDIKHPVLSGTCVASYMYLPIDEHTRGIFRAREQADSRLISASVTGDDNEYKGRDRVGKRPESTTLRGPHRIGREPPPDSDDWKLGGRKDEESIDRPMPDPPKPPDNADVIKIGRTMATITEMIAGVNEAGLHGGEAIAALQEAHNALERAVGALEQNLNVLAMLQGESTSQTLGDMTAIIRQAETDVRSLREQIKEIQNAIAASQEKGEELIGRWLS
jgi:hypothetical protein